MYWLLGMVEATIPKSPIYPGNRDAYFLKEGQRQIDSSNRLQRSIWR